MRLPDNFQRQWTVANAVFFAIGITLGAFHYPIDAEPSCRDLLCGGYGLVLGAMTGAAVGVAQWHLLGAILPAAGSSNDIARPRPGILSRWLAATTAGFAIGHGLGYAGVLIVVELPFSAVVYGIVSGLIIGGLQAIVLRPYVSKLSWWMLGSVLGFTSGLALTGLLYYAISDAERNPVAALDFPFTIPLFGIVQGLLLGSLYGLATHWALRRTCLGHLGEAGQIAD